MKERLFIGACSGAPEILYMALIENVHTKCPSWWGGKWQFCANEARGNALLVLTNGQHRFNRSHFHSLSFPNQSFSKWWHSQSKACRLHPIMKNPKQEPLQSTKQLTLIKHKLNDQSCKSFDWNIRTRKFKHDVYYLILIHINLNVEVSLRYQQKYFWCH